jgi:hypothetical protein
MHGQPHIRDNRIQWDALPNATRILTHRQGDTRRVSRLNQAHLTPVPNYNSLKQALPDMRRQSKHSTTRITVRNVHVM